MSIRSFEEKNAHREDRIALAEVASVFRRSWMAGVLTLLVGFLAVIGVALLSPRVYEGTVIAAFAAEADPRGAAAALSSLGTVGSMLTGMATDDGQMYERVEFLRSYAVSIEFLQKINAARLIFADDFDRQGNRWLKTPSEQDLYREFDEKVRRIEIDPRTGLLHVSIRLTDRVTAAEWANAFLSFADDRYRERALADVKERRKFIEQELSSADDMFLRQTLADLLKSEIRRQMLAQTGPSYAYRVVSPAYVSDEDEFVSPRLALIGVVGLTTSVALAFVAIFVFDSRRCSERVA